MTDGIFYVENNHVKLVGNTNSDWAGDVETRKSTSGYVFHLGSGVVSWSSNKQPIIALSMTEVEYIVATSCTTHKQYGLEEY